MNKTKKKVGEVEHSVKKDLVLNEKMASIILGLPSFRRLCSGQRTTEIFWEEGVLLQIKGFGRVQFTGQMEPVINWRCSRSFSRPQRQTHHGPPKIQRNVGSLGGKPP